MGNDCWPLLASATPVRASRVFAPMRSPAAPPGHGKRRVPKLALPANQGGALLTLQHREARCRRSGVARCRRISPRESALPEQQSDAQQGDGDARCRRSSVTRAVGVADAAQGNARCRRSTGRRALPVQHGARCPRGDRRQEVCAVAT
jgi:hypothetical protein